MAGVFNVEPLKSINEYYVTVYSCKSFYFHTRCLVDFNKLSDSMNDIFHTM